MSTKPSKNEIEKALAVQRARRKKFRTDKTRNVDAQLDSTTSRKQQVIGGDLTGISKRSRSRSQWTDYREYNAANWIAGGIVLAILAVFFWPQPQKTVREVNNAPLESAISVYDGESRIVEEDISDLKSTFSREDDIERATKFRIDDERDGQIRALLIQARAHESNGQFSLPAKNNALESYQAILKLDPRNVDARQGIGAIQERFLALGFRYLEGDDLDKAEDNLIKLANIDIDSDEHSELKAAITDWRKNQRIDSLLVKANGAIKANKIILPARQNALFFYQQIQQLDGANEAAAKGIQRISDSYIDKANQAILNGDYQAATGYLATVSVIDPDNPSIPLVQSVITKAKPIAEQAKSAQRSVPRSELRKTETTSSRASRLESETTNSRQSSPRKASGSASNLRTPKKEAQEQETIDRQYLDLGLDSYYKGDYETAVALLKPLADKGVSRAQMRIGYMVYLGRGFDKNTKEADRIVRAALPAVQNFADQGRSWAQSDIGSLYEDGLVLPKDYGEAVYWYRSAAEQGYPGAQTNLGIMYARGRGVGSNRKTAIEWFQKAAKQGDIAAKRNLESMGVKF